MFALIAIHDPTSDQFPLGMLCWDVHLVRELICRPTLQLCLLQALGRAGLTLLACGAEGTTQLLAPVHLLCLIDLEGLQRHIWRHLTLRITEDAVTHRCHLVHSLEKMGFI